MTTSREAARFQVVYAQPGAAGVLLRRCLPASVGDSLLWDTLLGVPMEGRLGLLFRIKLTDLDASPDFRYLLVGFPGFGDSDRMRRSFTKTREALETEHSADTTRPRLIRMLVGNIVDGLLGVVPGSIEEIILSD